MVHAQNRNNVIMIRDWRRHYLRPARPGQARGFMTLRRSTISKTADGRPLAASSHLNERDRKFSSLHENPESSPNNLQTGILSFKINICMTIRELRKFNRTGKCFKFWSRSSSLKPAFDLNGMSSKLCFLWQNTAKI